MKTKNLRCEYRTNPLGIDVRQPHLSWQIDSRRRGAQQTAYQVICWLDHSPLNLSSADGNAPVEEVLWDTGKIDSGNSIHIPYDGPDLQSRQRVHWQVRVWDENDHPTGWSDPAWFEMGYLSPDDWEAGWIGSPVVGGPRTTAPCPYLRKNFTIASEILSARLYITALGLYEACINGERVGQDIFTPGWTAYDKRVQYQVYDVASLLNRGSNTLGAILGDGWYCGNLEWRGRQLYGDRPRLLSQLEINLADGGRQVIITDGTWETTTGPLLESDLIVGEAYDARLELVDWCSPKCDVGNEMYNQKAKWIPAEVFPSPGDLQLVAQNGPTVRAHETLTPVGEPTQIWGWPIHKWIYDFGQNLVGRVQLKVKGPRGTTITLRFGEMLDADGRLYTQNLRTARQTDYYTLRGDPGGEVYESRFTFHGFRYVELSSYPGTPTREALVAVVLHSDNPPALEFECSDPLVNHLQGNIHWGWKGNSVDIPTDCPQRDERLGWTGDAQVFVKTATYLTDAAGFFTKWVQDLADAQLDYGAIPATAPVTPMLHKSDGGPAWSDAFIIVPWTIWQSYGDTRILERHYDAMCRYIDYLVDNSPGYIRLLPNQKELGAENEEWQIGGYGDWLAQDGSEDKRGVTPRDLIGTAFLAYDAKLMAQIAGTIGKTADAQRFSQLFTETRQAFINHFITPDGLMVGQTQTGYVLALHFDLVPEHLHPIITKGLINDIRARGVHISTGFVGTPYICQVLTDVGRIDLAYALLLQRSFPSWLYPVIHGATTIWERWDGWTEENGFQDPGMNSFNHYTYGAIGTWMYETITGIRTDPAHPGFKHIILSPRPGGKLTFARGTYQSPYGPIKSHWQLDERAFSWEVAIPPNTTAEVHIPAEPGSQIKEAGIPIEDSPGITPLRRTETAVIFEVGSGHYLFEVHP